MKQFSETNKKTALNLDFIVGLEIRFQSSIAGVECSLPFGIYRFISGTKPTVKPNKVLYSYLFRCIATVHSLLSSSSPSYLPQLQ